jgi:hypothetical protein
MSSQLPAAYFGHMDNEATMPAALCGITDGAAWVADDVFVTRCAGGDIMVERWSARGVRSVVVHEDTGGFMRAIWLKLNTVAVDGPPLLQD